MKVVSEREKTSFCPQNSQTSPFFKEMSAISFTMGDWHKVCAHFNLDMSEVLTLLTSGQVRSLTAERPVVSRASSVTAVSDSEDESDGAAAAAPKASKGNFATSKTCAFAVEHGISADSLTGSGKNGKITMEDVKKALPPKKRGRKPKPKAAPILDVVDSLPVEDAPKPVKAKKDPNKPKGPSGVWMQYLNAHRQEFRDSHPEAKMTAIVSMISVVYKALSDAEKQPFVELAAADKARYVKEMESYVPPVNVASAGKKAKKVKDPNAPKRVTSMWMVYLNAHRAPLRAANPGMPMPEILKLASVAYAALSDAEKQPWIEKVDADKIRYLKEWATYKPAEPKEASKEASKAPKAPKASKAPKAKKATKASKAPKASKAGGGGASAPTVSFEDAEEITFADEEEFELNGADSDDDELDEEDEAEEFEFQGTTYWKTWEGFVMDEKDGPKIGRWDAEDEVVVFDDDE